MPSSGATVAIRPAEVLQAQGRVEAAPAGRGSRVDGGAGRGGRGQVELDHPGAGAVVGPLEADRAEGGGGPGAELADVVEHPVRERGRRGPGQHEVLAGPGHALDQEAAGGVGEGGARPAGADALLGEHGGDGRPRRVLGGQERERVPPPPLGQEPARGRLGRAGAEPPLAAAGGAAEAERGEPPADDGGGRHREAVEVGDQQAEGLVPDEPAEPVGPGQPVGEPDRVDPLGLPDDGVGLADAGDQGMDAELDPFPWPAVQVGREPVDGAQQRQGVVVGEGDRAGPFDRTGRVPRGELDQAAQGDPGHAAVVDVDGLVRDRVQALAGTGAQGGQDVVAAGQAVGERAALGRARPKLLTLTEPPAARARRVSTASSAVPKRWPGRWSRRQECRWGRSAAGPKLTNWATLAWAARRLSTSSLSGAIGGG